MGFLDNKGVKKLVNWVKDYVGKNTVGEDKLNNKQDKWRYNTSCLMDSVLSYRISPLNYGVVPYFSNEDGFERSIIPDRDREYKIRNTGKVLNTIYWPSVFDMPWPNNEIPNFELDHEYEIYIAGGRVVSVDDITPPVEEVSYTITQIEGEPTQFTVNSAGGKLSYYIDGEYVKYGNTYVISGFEGLTLTYTVKGDLSKIFKISSINLQYIKVDCSKMKSNNLHHVLNGLKVDEIIYPQACIGMIDNPVYNFEAPEVNLNCLRNNKLYNPVFDFVTDDLRNVGYLEYIFDYDHELFGNKISNINANKILRVMYDQGYEFYTDNLQNLKTIGTLAYNIVLNNPEIRKTIYLFGHFFIPSEGVFNGIAKEFIIISNAKEYTISILTSNSIGFIGKFDTLKISIPFGYLTLYYIEGDLNNIELGGSVNVIDRVTFIKVNSVEEVPFQYAPASWDDVKNYDDEGNVIE